MIRTWADLLARLPEAPQVPFLGYATVTVEASLHLAAVAAPAGRPVTIALEHVA